MKIAAIIFTCLGVAANFFWLPWYIGLLGVVLGVIMIASLCADKKSIAIGILGIFFTSLLGGIFYLCWDPEKN